jgi:ribosomal protein S8
MSLVNLAHACSHLQNASLARLGLTSIPYTRLHLSLALLLQKQGFISDVKLAGPSPPASAFGHGPRDNHQVTNYPHDASGRNRHSPESALALVVRKQYTESQLRALGFPQESIEFAQEHGTRNLDGMVKLGWAKAAVNVILDIRAQIEAVMKEREGYAKEQMEVLSRLSDFQKDNMLSKNTEDAIRKEVVASLPEVQRMLFEKYNSLSLDELRNERFDLTTLHAISGPQKYITERELNLTGITIEAMGLPVSNQQVTLPMEDFQDPAHMETEGVVTRENRASRRLWLGMKYYESMPVLTKARMISKPTKRIWLNWQDLGKIVRGSQAKEVKPLTKVGEIMAISTDRGILDARECVERKIGGQALCRVW